MSHQQNPSPKRRAASLSHALALFSLILGACNEPPDAETSLGDSWSPPIGQWQLVWSDEFEGPEGSKPDPSKWKAEVGGHGWGNQELQFHTDRPENARLDGNGFLVVEARKEPFENRLYTSARLKTFGLFERKYGRFEARMKLPHGKGMWPAFWLLGANFPQVGWPECGEIDIMELAGSRPHIVHGTLHGPGYSGMGGTPLHRSFELPDGQRFSDDFHVFAIEWTAGGIRWFVDDNLYHVRSVEGMAARNQRWVYNEPFFIIVNVAVGGRYDGNPDTATQFPQAMLIDYVRVYELTPPGSSLDDS